MKYPLKYARDCGPGQTMGELCEMVADVIDTGDKVKFADVMDEYFIYGSWGHLLEEPEKGKLPHEVTDIQHSPFENLLLNKDIRGLAYVMYQLGRKRSATKVRKEIPSEETMRERARKLKSGVDGPMCPVCGYNAYSKSGDWCYAHLLEHVIGRTLKNLDEAGK